ncbi:ankyrin repeat domain-containing protein 17-like isoform X2 [Oppia nitens]|uniref:ankyrin repeat domain-containing protein 17-like isoform X2 n=1 Tax=Oppia nitens TaxID=1686743 RepID=UPI0023DACCB8|nr:ankyrin repeat domain-containing protein 17-like isoform X2 [Oppia nitens]
MSATDYRSDKHIKIDTNRMSDHTSSTSGSSDRQTNCVKMQNALQDNNTTIDQTDINCDDQQHRMTSVNKWCQDMTAQKSVQTAATAKCSSPKLNLMAELFESEEEDDDNSEVESFTLDEESSVMDSKTSKFLLSAETCDSKLTSHMDAQSRTNLEALLDGDKQLLDADILRRIASSLAVNDVHLALDEAAQAIAKMRINESQLTSLTNDSQHESDGTQVLTSDVEASHLIDDTADRSERCSVNEVTEEGESFLSFACASGHYELAKQLLVARANVEDRGLKDTTPLMEAASAGHLKLVELLIQHNAEVNAQTSQGNTPLMYACAGGHEDVVRFLLKHGANVEDHNENGHTPLMEAASAGHVNVAAILVESGASINTHSNEFKESALTLACYKGHLEMVRFLLEAGADQEHKTDEMHTALMEASMDGHVEVARLLLDSGAQVNMPADSFESPLTLAACGGHVELAMLLLERGANIEEVNDEGYTPLMEAAREGHEEMVALLLSQGADINAQTEETQETALTLACCGGFIDVADFLIKAGADIEAGANTPLMEAAQEGHLDLVRHLINSGANVNATTSSGDTALMYASENGHTDVAELLLQAGAHLEHEAEGGRTSIMKAARAGHLCTVQFLINKGANVNKVTTNNDHTPLSLACAGGHLAVVELLLANGADPTHRLKDSSTMLIEAAKGGHTTVVQLLIDYPTNIMTPSPTNQSITSEISSRVPSHGLHIDETPSRTQSSIPSIQSKLNIQKSISKKSLSKDSSLPNASNNLSNKVSDTVDSYVSFSKGRTANKVLERSLSDSGNGLSLTPPSNLGLSESSAFSSIDALKEAERLEARINDMIRRTDELDPAKEEQIRQKQQILEELQRVEREYQAHWQQQLIQCYQAGLSCGPSLSQLSSNLPPLDANTVNASTASQGLPLFFDKSLKTDLPFQLPSPISQTSSIDITSTEFAMVPTQTSITNTINTSTNTTNSMATPPVNRRFRSNSKIKSLSAKHAHQTCVNTNYKTNSIQLNAEEVDKLNMKNTINSEQQSTASNVSTIGQQTQNLLQQQQMILSELAQNFSSRPETLQFLQAAASNIKMDSSLPFLLPRLFESTNSLTNQTSVIQSHQSLSTTQSTTQTNTMTNTTANNENTKKLFQISKTTKNTTKSAKVDNSFNGQPLSTVTPNASGLHQSNQTTQTSSFLQSLTSEQLMLLKSQFAAASSTATQTDEHLSSSAQSVFNSGSNSAIYSMGAPAFPVSLTLSPVTVSPQSSTTTASNISTTVQSSTVIPQSIVSDSTTNQNETISLVTPINSTQVLSSMTTTAIESDSSANTTTSENLNDSSVFSNVSTIITTSLSQSVNSMSLGTNMSYSLPNSVDLLHTQSIDSSDLMLTPSNKSDQTTVTNSTNMRIPSPPPFYPPVDLDSQTDSNHDTALTLACAGGHEELVSLLLNRGSEIEHRDKKGFTPLMLSATAGHLNVVEILLNNGADMEAQSERTKDTALSLACSSGRYEVVELLLSRGANKEHRNVSDYTPLSLAASGGYVNIIKLLLSHGAEINSRTGSKLGISPLMLAAMNGHAATVRLLLDMGSDINAQIETNRNTALTLACFQGRCEVVGLLLDRKANVEHRAKTGLTPLMEAASGGYVEVGRVLLDKGADVNATPVPSSRDTALTIAADKGHYRFVELLLSRNAAIDVKNKKGNSPLWLACNGGHIDVVQLLVNAGCDIDSQDNRKVSCLMSAFRKGHVKVVKWMVKHVNQFPSDQEITRFIALINDKELIKKTNQCAEILRQAKERQAAEANKNATILLEEIDLERTREETRKAAAARRRERKRLKKKEKQDLIKASKTTGSTDKDGKLLKIEDDDDNDDDDNEDDNEEDDEIVVEEVTRVPVTVPTLPKAPKSTSNQFPKEIPTEEKRKISSKENEKPKKLTNNLMTQTSNTVNKKSGLPQTSSKNKKKDEPNICVELNNERLNNKLNSLHSSSGHKVVSDNSNHKNNEIFSELSVDTNETASSTSHRSPCNVHKMTTSTNNVSNNQTNSKKCQKREEGWKEVVRKSKKVVVPSNAISRVIGRGGCNINAIREISGAHIEVEKQKGQGDRMVVIKGSADATRHAQQLIVALSKETDKDLSEIIKSMGLSRPTSVSSDEIITTKNPQKSQSTAIMASTHRSHNTNNVLKSSSMSSVSSMSSTSNVTTFTNRSTLLVKPTAMNTQLSAPFVNAWTNRSNNSRTSPLTTTTTVATPIVNSNTTNSSAVIASTYSTQPLSVSTKSTVSYTMAVASKGKNTKTTTTISNTHVSNSKIISSSEIKPTIPTMTNQIRPTGAPHGVQPFNNQVFSGARVAVPMANANGVKNMSHLPSTKQPFNNVQTITTTQSPTKSSTVASTDESSKPLTTTTTPEYTPFNNLFSKVAQGSVWGQSKDKPNFASVAASGLPTNTSAISNNTTSLSVPIGVLVQQQSTKELSIDASKAPGYRGNLHVSPSTSMTASGSSNLGPIGSGHTRSAPCTPPLILNAGQLTPSSATKLTTPPLSGTPTPPPRNQSLSMTDSHNTSYLLTNESKQSPVSANPSPSHQLITTSNITSTSNVSSYQQLFQSNSLNSPNPSTIVPNAIKSSHNYSMSSPMNVSQRHSYGNNSVYNQNMQSSVHQMQMNSEQNLSYNVSQSNIIQSNLNPNAPDFSTRVLQPTQAANGSSMAAQKRMAMNSVPNANAIVLQDQMRAAILAASANLQLQTLQKQQAVRMQMAATSGLHATDFVNNTPPPSPETLRLLHTAINSLPNAGSNQSLQQLTLMQNSNYIQQQQQQQQTQQSRLAQSHLNSMSAQKDIENSVSDYEERRLPRPIGTERAQRKHPNPIYQQMNSMSNMNDSIWPLEAPNDMTDWIQSQQQQQTQMPNTNIMSDINQSRFNADDMQHLESTQYQMNMASHYSTPTLPLMGINGVPPPLSSALYQSLSTNTGITGTDSDYWNAKMALSAMNVNLDNTLPSNQSSNSDQKLNWNHWNHQT